MNEISNGKMVKGCLKVSILFKTDILLKCFAPHNAQLVISNHSYVEVFSGSRLLRRNEVQLYYNIIYRIPQLLSAHALI